MRAQLQSFIRRHVCMAALGSPPRRRIEECTPEGVARQGPVPRLYARTGGTLMSAEKPHRIRVRVLDGKRREWNKLKGSLVRIWM